MRTSNLTCETSNLELARARHWPLVFTYRNNHTEVDTMDKVLLTVNECAEQLNLGRTKLYELIKEGEIESVQVGRRRLIPASEATRFVERLLS